MTYEKRQQRLEACFRNFNRLGQGRWLTAKRKGSIRRMKKQAGWFRAMFSLLHPALKKFR